MYDELLERVKAIKPNIFSDDVLESLFHEAAAGLKEDQPDFSAGIDTDNILLYYVLSQVSLFSGDMEDYENYRTLYNHALSGFRKKIFEKTPANPQKSRFQNLW